MRGRILALVLAVVAVAGASVVTADEGRFFVGLQAGVYEPSGFSNSFDAIYGDTLTPIGIRAELAWTSWFAALNLSRMSSSGERVVFLPEPFPTGVGSKLTLEPVRLTVARRFRPEAPWRPHFGAGVVLMSWQEETDFESADGADLGAHLTAGLAWHRQRMRVGGEVVYSSIPNAIEGPTAEHYGEDDLGGIELSLFAGWSF